MSDVQDNPEQPGEPAARTASAPTPPQTNGKLPEPGAARNLDLIMRIPVQVQVILGRAKMPVAELMQLQRGSVIALDHQVGEAVEVTANGRTIARGEVVLMDDDPSRFGVSLTQIVDGALEQ